MRPRGDRNRREQVIMPSIPQSLLWISLVVLWLFVLVPMLISKRDAVRRTSDVALATRVLNGGAGPACSSAPVRRPVIAATPTGSRRKTGTPSRSTAPSPTLTTTDHSAARRSRHRRDDAAAVGRHGDGCGLIRSPSLPSPTISTSTWSTRTRPPCRSAPAMRGPPKPALLAVDGEQSEETEADALDAHVDDDELARRRVRIRRGLFRFGARGRRRGHGRRAARPTR